MPKTSSVRSNPRKSYRTKRLILRPYRMEDYSVWFDAYVHRLPQQSKYDLAPRDPKDCMRSDFRKIVRHHEKIARADECYIYGIFEKKTGALVGAVDIYIMIRSSYQMGNLGYRIHNRYWKQGYGKEAALAALKIGFKDLGLNRLEAAINLDNRGSMALARSIGMRREGIKKRYLFEKGQWTDHVVFAANPEDIGLKPKKANY